MSQTTIRVSTKTRDALERLKIVPQDPLDAVIGRLIAGKDDEGEMQDSVNVLMRERLRKLRESLTVDEARKYAHTLAQGSHKGSGVRSRTSSSRKRS